MLPQLPEIKKAKPKFGLTFFVPRTGIEPARPKTVTRPSTWRVYQFRHLGKIFDFAQSAEAFAAVWPLVKLIHRINF